MVSLFAESTIRIHNLIMTDTAPLPPPPLPSSTQGRLAAEVERLRLLASSSPSFQPQELAGRVCSQVVTLTARMGMELESLHRYGMGTLHRCSKSDTQATVASASAGCIYTGVCITCVYCMCESVLVCVHVY